MIHFWAWPPLNCLQFIHNDDLTCVCVRILATEAWRRAITWQAVQKGRPPKIAKATPISWRWQIVTNFPISVLFVSGLLASGRIFRGHMFIWIDLVEKVCVQQRVITSCLWLCYLRSCTGILILRHRLRVPCLEIRKSRRWFMRPRL